jgi:Trypsin-co-occurring domain 2
MAEQWVGLAEAVRALREELTTAMKTAKDEVLRFELGPVEMEFLLEVKKDAGRQGGVRFYVVSLGGNASMSSGSTHRVKLSMTPKDALGQSPLISDEE